MAVDDRRYGFLQSKVTDAQMTIRRDKPAIHSVVANDGIFFGKLYRIVQVKSVNLTIKNYQKELRSGGESGMILYEKVSGGVLPFLGGTLPGGPFLLYIIW